MLKRFAQANVIQPSCYYSCKSTIQNPPDSARPPTPAASQRCTERQPTGAWLYEHSELKVVVGLRPKHDDRTGQAGA